MRAYTTIALALLPLFMYGQASHIVTYKATNNSLKKTFSRMRQFANGQQSTLFSDESLQTERIMELTTDGRRSMFTEREDSEELDDDDGPEIIYVSQEHWGEERRVFKDYVNTRIVMEQYFHARPYLISDTTFVRHWKIGDEHKEIMGLTCQKATSADTITAWFAIDVPIPDGPHTYGGLPGLILKLDDNMEQYECISIEETERSVPKEPERGQHMTMKEFLAVVDDHFSHMGERLGYE